MLLHLLVALFHPRLHLICFHYAGKHHLSPLHALPVATQRMRPLIGHCELLESFIIGGGQQVVAVYLEEPFVDPAAGHEDEENADDQANNKRNTLFDCEVGF